MITSSSIRRIAMASIILLLLILFCIFPKSKDYELDLTDKKSVEYVSSNTKHETYLLDSDNYIARTSVLLKSRTLEGQIKELLEYLIIDGKKESSIPNGFRAIIPSDTKVNSISVDGEVAKVNFSKEFLDTKEDLEEKMIEAIIYSLTSIKGITGVIIYVDGNILTTLPKTNINLPALLTRNFGINKSYDILTTSNITSTTVYYINKHNDAYYYVPVTKYTNDGRDKIKIIIDELTSGPIYETNLMSFLNTNAKLLNYEIKDKQMMLNFNDFIFDDIKDKKILEEVIYSIALSVGDNYNVNEVVFMVNNEKIEKSVLKTIE